MYHHVPNKACINCGAENPTGTLVTQDNDYFKIDCSKCSQRLFEGIIARDGEPADVPPWINIPDFPRARDEIPDDVSWTQWEIYWSPHSHAVVLNGVLVAGDSDFYNLVTDHL
jgi:DNA-directed RNA polymerase subunit RPC12/RpoP